MIGIIKRLKLYYFRTIILRSKLFDSSYYLRSNPDVRLADIDPIIHYLKHGWKEGRNPNQSFDTSFYLENNVDVKRKGINPFLHFIRHGIFEGRLTNQKQKNEARTGK